MPGVDHAHRLDLGAAARADGVDEVDVAAEVDDDVLVGRTGARVRQGVRGAQVGVSQQVQ
ncbi:hypothetical protein M3672_01015 [Microbacterium enclense]|nr:hypothetical protein [Microbacterium enclense]